MRVIGVTGGLGTGKSTVAAMLARLGAKVVDADKIARRLLNPDEACFGPVVRMFGRDILTRGRVDRKKVARVVFRDPARLKKLERVIHPEVRKVILSEIQKLKERGRTAILVVDVPLLFEAGFDNLVDRSVVVTAAMAVQIERAAKKLGITKAEARRRIKAQMPLRQKIRFADIIIDNNGTLIQTKKQVKRLWEKL
jgi:dephospho-CoA kinase